MILKSREDQGQLLENYVYKRLTNLYDKDNIKFWRTADKKEIDFVVTTSFNEGLAYEVKMTCRNLNSTSEKKFTWRIIRATGFKRFLMLLITNVSGF
jgi:uncharacterized protein